jgi:hypothetical protein
VFSMTGKDEDEEESASEAEEEGKIGAEEDDDAHGEEEGIEAEKTAGDAVVEEVAETPAQNEDIPPEVPELDAAGSEESGPGVSAEEPSSEPLQEKEPASADVSSAAEPSAEEEAALPTQTAPEEIEPNSFPGSADSGAAEAVVRDLEAVPAAESMEPDNRTSEESIETADASAEQVPAPEVPVADKPVEGVNQDSRGPDTASETEEEPVDSPQLPDHDAKSIASDSIEVVETSEHASHDPSSTETIGEDTSQEDQSSQYIPEELSSTSEAESSTSARVAESDMPDVEEAPTESEDMPDSSPAEPIEDPDEIVQIIDVNGDGSTDNTAAIVVVPIPPPPPTGPHVTIAEPIKPPKSSKKKSSSGKSNKSRSAGKPKEKHVEIIQLKEAKSKSVAKGKGKKKSKTTSRKGDEAEAGDLVPPPPPPMMVDFPPRAPSPPPSGLIVEVVGDEAVQVVEPSAVDEGDHATGVGVVTALEAAESEVVEIVEAEETTIVALPDQEEESVEAIAQEENIASADLPPTPEADIIESSLEDGDSGEGVESGAGVDDKPQLTHEKAKFQSETDPASSEDPPMDGPPDGGVFEDTHEEEPDPAGVQPMKADKLDQVPVATASEEGTASAEAANNGEDRAMSPESSIEQEEFKENTAEGALEDDSASATVETDSMDIPHEDVAPSTAAEDTSAPIEEAKNAAAEVFTESTPTSMELVALILPGNSAIERTEYTAVPDVVPSDTDVSTKEVGSLDEISDIIPETGVGEDNDIGAVPVVTVLPDEEDAVDVPPEAPMPPETDVLDIKLESDEESEASKYQTTVEAIEEVMDQDIEPKNTLQVVAPDPEVALAGEDLESKPENQSRDITPQHPEEVETFDEALVDELESSPDSNASPVQVEKTPKADVSIPSSDADVPKEGVKVVMNLVEEAAELNETVPATLDEPDLASAVVEEPEVFEEVEAQKDSPDCNPDDTGVNQVEKIDAATAEEEEEKALTSSADGTGAQDTVSHAIDQVGKEVASVISEPDHSEDVTSHHVIEEVEEPAVDEVGSVVASGHISEQSEQPGEPIIVKSADSETCETPGERVSADITNFPDTEDLSDQPLEPPADHISDKEQDTAIDPINISDNATTSTSGNGAQTEEQDSPDLSMPVLAEETQVVQVIEAPEETGKPEENKKKAAEPVDTAPSLEETLEPNETSSPEHQPEVPAEEQTIPSTEEYAIELPQLEGVPAPEGPVVSAEQVEPGTEAQSDPQEYPTIAEAEMLPEDSISQQQSRYETIPDPEPERAPPVIEEPASDLPAPVEVAAPSPSKHSSKVSFDEPPVSPKDNELISPPKKRRKSSKSSSHRHSSSHNKVKDVSHPPSEPQPTPSQNQSRRRSSTVQAPPLGLFRKSSSAKPRSSRSEAAEHAEIRRRAAELAAREEDVQRQLRRARRLVALEEQERKLREKEEELARLEAVEREKKRARHEERRRREQEALEQERERAEEAARQKELERAERRRRRKEAESLEGRRHRDDRSRVRGHKTEDTGAERQRSRDEYYVRETPSSSKQPEQRRHRRSSHRDSDEKPKKGFWKSLLRKV